jgi:hypothetical protein
VKLDGPAVSALGMRRAIAMFAMASHRMGVQNLLSQLKLLRASEGTLSRSGPVRLHLQSFTPPPVSRR